MPRTLRDAATATALAAAALVSSPTLAAASALPMGPGSGGPAPVISCDGNCQFAGGDIFNAGRDNIVGSGDNDQAPGVGVPAPTTFLTIVNNTNFTLTRTAQTGVGDYPPSLVSFGAAAFLAEGSSGASYAGGGQTASVTVNQFGTVQCGPGSLTCMVTEGPFGPVVSLT